MAVAGCARGVCHPLPLSAVQEAKACEADSGKGGEGCFCLDWSVAQNLFHMLVQDVESRFGHSAVVISAYFI